MFKPCLVCSRIERPNNPLLVRKLKTSALRGLEAKQITYIENLNRELDALIKDACAS